MHIQVDSNGYPFLDQFSEEGFVDCAFKITEFDESPEYFLFKLMASHNGRELGFKVEVLKNIESGFNSEWQLYSDHVYKKGVKFIRSGPESDSLISLLASLYGMEECSRKMTPQETFTCIALHQGELNLRAECVKLKLFGRDSGSDVDLDECYYESFFNLDLENGFVFWNEKDMDYRKPLIQGLTEASD